MFNDRQVKLLKQQPRNDLLSVYIVASGTVIYNVHGQKGPYLYSIVIRPHYVNVSVLIKFSQKTSVLP